MILVDELLQVQVAQSLEPTKGFVVVAKPVMRRVGRSTLWEYPDRLRLMVEKQCTLLCCDVVE